MQAAEDTCDRRQTEQELRLALTPPATEVLHLLTNARDGLKLLTELRHDLLRLVDEDPGLSALDQELRTLFTTVFDGAALTLERVTWRSPTSLLEKLMQHEAVHAIESWAHLKTRLSGGRRCYALFHTSMPDDPLAFVELAFTSGIVRNLPELLDDARPDDGVRHSDTAVFYSIFTCPPGLAGVKLANLLLKQTLDEVAHECPGIRQFVTLSPLAGFREWIEDSPFSRGILTGRTAETSVDLDDALREPLLALCARYLTSRRGQRCIDTIANFHLSNGASIESLNWRADPSSTGIQRSFGIMATYAYEPAHVAEQANAYAMLGTITISPEVGDLLGEAPAGTTVVRPRARRRS